MSNALDEFKGVADAGITPDDNPGLEIFVEGAGEMPAPQPSVELAKSAKKGDNVLVQIEMYLRSKYQFRYNLVTSKVEFRHVAGVDFKDMTDFDYHSLLRELKHSDLPCSISSLRQILASDFVVSYDPYLEFVNTLPAWDGQDHIGALVATVKTDNPDFWEVCLRKWLVAMVTAWITPEVVNHTALILCGPQGCGKTSWLKRVIPDALNHYIYAGKINVRDKDSLIKLSECCLIVMDELENMHRDLDALKELITKTNIYVRRAYGFVHENYTRRASFAGSINNHDFLHDMTGNRRFLCFETKYIDYQFDIDMSQVYAQAIALERSGFQYWFDKDEMAVLERNNEAFRAVCVEEEQLTSFYEPCNEDDDGVLFMKTTDILKSLLQLSGLRSLSDQKLGRVLMSLDYKRVKKDGRYGYLLRLRKPSVPDSLLSELEPVVEVQVPEEIELAQLPVARIGRVQRRQV